MGLFNARAAAKEVAAQIEQPDMSAAELEQMVYATYQEKLDLAKQLDSAKARIESLEETLQEKTTKLRAAEEFARQSESEFLPETEEVTSYDGSFIEFIRQLY